MQRRTTTLALIGAAAALMFALRSHAQPFAGVDTAAHLPCNYRVTVIWPGPSVCGAARPRLFPQDINRHGAICGYFRCGPSNERAFVWWPSGDGATGDFVALPMPPGTSHSRAHGVSDDGLIAGWFNNSSNDPPRQGFLHDGVTLTPLGTLPGGTMSQAHGVLEGGIVVGWWGNNIIGGPSIEAFVWSDGVMQGLGRALGTPASHAAAISPFGIVGWARPEEEEKRAFLLQGSTAIDLGHIPGGISGEAVAVTADGTVLVQGLAAETGSWWRSFIWKDGEWTDIGALPGYKETRVNDINASGTAIGECRAALGVQRGWFAWHDGVFIDLSEHVLLDEMGWIAPPQAINDSGQIVMGGTLAGHSGIATFVLAPIARRMGDVNCDSVVDELDMLAILDDWGVCGLCDADLDQDGEVGSSDLMLVLMNWG